MEVITKRFQRKKIWVRFSKNLEAMLWSSTPTPWRLRSRSIMTDISMSGDFVLDYDFRGNFVRIISEDLANPSPHIERLRNMEENLQMAGSKNTDIVAAESFPNDSTNNYDQSLFRDDYRGHSEQSGATKSPGTTSENSNSFQDNQDMALSRLSGGANTDHSVNDTSSPFNGMSRDSETSPEGDGLPEIPGPHKQHELPVTFLRKPEVCKIFIQQIFFKWHFAPFVNLHKR